MRQHECNIYSIISYRFKQLPYATEEDKNMASKPIKEMLVKLIEDEGEHQVNDDNIVELSRKKSRLSGKYLFNLSYSHLHYIIFFFNNSTLIIYLLI